MAGFMLSHVMEFRNEVALANIWEQCLDFDGSRIGRTTVKKAVFPLVGRSGRFRKMSAKRKQKLGAICLSQSHVNSLGSGEGDDAVAEISKGEYASKTDSNRNFDVVYDGNGSNGKFTFGEDVYGGDGNNGNFTNGRGGGGSGYGDEVGKDNDKYEIGPVLKLEEVVKKVDRAKSVGIHRFTSTCRS